MTYPAAITTRLGFRPPRVGANADRAIWIARELLVASQPSAATHWKTGGLRPADLSKASGMGRLEAELALRLLVEYGQAIRRRDGRYFYKEAKYS